MSRGSDDANGREATSLADPVSSILRGLFGPVLDVTKRLPAPLAYALAVAVLIASLALLPKAGAVVGGPLVWLLGVVVCLGFVAYVFTEWNNRSSPQKPTTSRFSDKRVDDTAQALNSLEAAGGDRASILSQLRSLFDRKTFTEPLRECPNQLWADRLDSCYQTLRLLQQCERNVRRLAPDLDRRYIELRTEIDRYAMRMGACLFTPEVDYGKVEAHIGKATFKAHLPAEKKFAKLPNGNPNIPDEVADGIEKHRLRAVELKDGLK